MRRRVRAKRGRNMIQLSVNGTEQSFNGVPEMPLLWYLRDILGLTGSKFGCGIGLCAAKPDAAAKFRSGQPQNIAQIPEERHFGNTIERLLSSVYRQLDHVPASFRTHPPTHTLVLLTRLGRRVDAGVSPPVRRT